MRLVTYKTATGPRIAGRREGELVDLNQADAELPHQMRALLALGREGIERAERALQNGQPLPLPVVLLPPVPDPEKVICVGLNYADHAAESGLPIPAEPVIFNKFPTAIVAHQDPIVLPSCSRQVDYEAELVVVIGRQGRDIPQSQAMDHIAGYACGHDVSARDWQTEKPAGQWLLGKTFDTFAPFGPDLVTADEVPEPGQLPIRLRLNGRTMQESNTRQLIFSIAHLISYISGVCTLKAGDILFTGTPPGVGVARKPPVFLQPGDTVEVEIETIGLLVNPVVAAAATDSRIRRLN
jgi:2-keto-4-pentenoate hydratase/2-oxohepta-3-ene-1,7-dioic acid hydratase in catechol pathway